MSSRIVVMICIAAAQVVHSRELPQDPLNSVMWEHMADRFFPGEIIVDQRVVVHAPKEAENQLQVPVIVDATGLEGVVEIVAVADLNPLPHILTFKPVQAQAFLGFRLKLEQSSAVRAGVRTEDGVWHVNGVVVEAAGGGCSAPAMAHINPDWYKTLGQTRAIARREATGAARLSLRMRHPMDTGLAPGIPVFHMNNIEVASADGDVLARLEIFEPVSENPTLTLKPLLENDVSELLVYARDTEANEFQVSLPVAATADN